MTILNKITYLEYGRLTKRFIFGLSCLLFFTVNIIGQPNAVEDSLKSQLDNKVKKGIFVDALYLRTIEIENNDPQSGAFLSLNFDTKHEWGFRLGGVSPFGDSADNKLYWWHYRNDFTDNNNTVDELKGEGATQVPYGYDSDFDLVMYELGRTLAFEDHASIRFHAGIEYAYIHVGYRYNYTTNTTQSTHNFREFFTYNGVGPRIGLELNYGFTPRVSLDLGGAISVLAKWGRHDLDRTQVDRRAGQPDRTISKKVSDSSDGVLVGADTNIVLDYTAQHRWGLVTYSGGLQGVIFLEDMAKWGGFIFGIKWTNEI